MFVVVQLTISCTLAPAERTKQEVRHDTRRGAATARIDERDRYRTREHRIREREPSRVRERPRPAVNMQTAAGRQRVHLKQFSPDRPSGAARVAAGQEDGTRTVALPPSLATTSKHRRRPLCLLRP